jgi:hypothetical protein
MNKTTILVSREDAKKQVKLLMYQWCYSVITEIGIEFGDEIPEDGNPDSLTILQQAKMRKTLSDNKIFILDDKDETLEIYVEEELIAKWEKPCYKLHYDRTKINPKERYYVEVEISFSSIFDQIEENKNE